MIKSLVGLAALAALGFAADESADRKAIQQAIGALNERNWRAATVTSDPAALAEFQRLLRGKNLTYRIRPGAGRTATVAAGHGNAGRPAVKVAAPSIELQNPRVVAGAVRFVSDDVAMADASLVEWLGRDRRTTPLLFVMKRDAGVWKIAELRVLADRQLLAVAR